MNRAQILPQLFCLAVGVLGLWRGWQGNQESPGILTAGELKIVDANGVERIVLACPDADRAEIRLVNARGQTRSVLSVSTETEGDFDPQPADDIQLEFLAPDGDRVASFFANDGFHHGPHEGLKFFYAENEPSIALETSQIMGSGPHLTFRGANPGRTVVTLGTGQMSDEPSLLMVAHGVDDRFGATGEGVVFLGYGFSPLPDGERSATMHMGFEDAGVQLDIDKDGQGRVMTKTRGGEFKEMGGD